MESERKLRQMEEEKLEAKEGKNAGSKSANSTLYVLIRQRSFVIS